MREIYFNSDITPKSTNEIKLLALYYDKVHIVNDAVYYPKFDKKDGQVQFSGVGDIQFIPKTFTSDFKLLIDENLISITKRDENANDPYEKMFSQKISEILNKNEDLIFPKHPTESDGYIITEEVYEIMKYMFDFEWGRPVDSGMIWWYYSFKLKWFLKLLMNGDSCISSSNNLNNLFALFIKDATKYQDLSCFKGNTKSLAFDALKYNLPNPDMLSFEDILELKCKLKDELQYFYQTINSIEIKNKELLNSGIDDKAYQSIFFNDIQKPLTDLEKNMKNLKSRTFRKFIEKMQDPKSYVPMIGTVVASMPVQYALFASLGLTTGLTYLEYLEDKREITNNGLYFLLKMKS